MQIADWPATLRSKSFWAAYFAPMIELAPGDGDADAFLDDVFGLSGDERVYSGPFTRLTRGDEYDEDDDDADVPTNVLAVPAAGFTWRITFAPTPGIYHALIDVSGNELRLGHLDPHFFMPILRWDEVFDVGRAAQRAAPADLKPFVPLLFHTTAWIAKDDDIASVRARACDDWRVAGVVSEPQIARFVARYTTPFDEPVRWTRDDTRGFVNDSTNSYRNPANGADSDDNDDDDDDDDDTWWTAASFARFATFLDAAKR